jgi:hypothetical protein
MVFTFPAFVVWVIIGLFVCWFVGLLGTECGRNGGCIEQMSAGFLIIMGSGMMIAMAHIILEGIQDIFR